jgi:hypothetical protein
MSYEVYKVGKNIQIFPKKFENVPNVKRGHLESRYETCFLFLGHGSKVCLQNLAFGKVSGSESRLLVDFWIISGGRLEAGFWLTPDLKSRILVDLKTMVPRVPLGIPLNFFCLE